MPRAQLVTRTFKSTKVLAAACDTETLATVKKEITLPHAYSDSESILKVLQKKHNTETTKFVAVLSFEVTEGLYGMTEEKFLENAELLPPRVKKD